MFYDNEKGMEIICNKLKTNDNIISLDFSNNPIGDEGGLVLAKVLHEKQNWESLSLNSCDLRESALIGLFIAAKGHKNLKILRYASILD